MKQTFREKALVFNSDSPQLSHSYEWINIWAQLRLQSQNEHVKQKVLWSAFFGIFLSSAPKFSSFCKFLVNQGESKYASLGFRWWPASLASEKVSQYCILIFWCGVPVSQSLNPFTWVILWQLPVFLLLGRCLLCFCHWHSEGLMT